MAKSTMPPKISLPFLLALLLIIISITGIDSQKAKPRTKSNKIITSHRDRHQNPSTSTSTSTSTSSNDLLLPLKSAILGLDEKSTSPFLAQVFRPLDRTCAESASVCWARDSAGPSCCGSRCVDVSSDQLNCGRCGRMCGFAEICCGGDCVDPSKDDSHCGGCNNYCTGKGNSCAYGLCGYAN